MADDIRFRQVARYASAHGFVAGFPNFQEANHGPGVVRGTFLLRGNAAEGRDVPRDTYGVYHIEDVPALFRAANDYAGANGYGAAFPNGEQALVNGAVVYGTVLIKPGVTVFRDVPRDELHNPHIDDLPAMRR